MVFDIALIGFGEAGSAFANAVGWNGAARAYDTDPGRRSAMEKAGVEVCASAQDALDTAEIILSLVTAESAVATAQDYARFMRSGAIWCDMNSVAPASKLAAAEVVEAAGGRYVDVAILAPVNPALLNVSLFLSGEAAADAKKLLRQAGFTNLRVVGSQIGRASAIKLVRSIMIKGIESLTAEMMLAANALGIADEVLASIEASECNRSWPERVAYTSERMTRHGLRRAAEMAEAARLLRSQGVEPVMTDATIRRQREMAENKVKLSVVESGDQ